MARYYREKSYGPGDLASHAAWQRETIRKLEEEFTESRILRLASTKPAKIIDLRQAKQILGNLKKFRYFARPAGEKVLFMGSYNEVAKVDKKRNGWQGLEYWVSFGYPGVYITTSTKIAKLDLLIDNLGGLC